MQGSTDRILTTHVGSLPRPRALADLLIRHERGEAIDAAQRDRLITEAVEMVVHQQAEAGIDIGNDGEQPRVGFQTYVAQRMQGFGGESARPPSRDQVEFPDFSALLQERRKNTAKIPTRRRPLPRCATRICVLQSRNATCSYVVPQQFPLLNGS
jgi:5-methyltetrahydropteroyltriglutamate--homocysteine methyltransferase